MTDPAIPRPKHEPSSIARGGLESLLFRAVEVVCQLVLVALTARLMGPEGRGFYAIAALTATMCSIVLGPVWVGHATELARGRASPRELLGSSLTVATLGGLATAAVGLLVALVVGDEWWVIGFPAATAPFILLARYGEGLYQALGHVRAVNVITVARVGLALLFITPPLLLGGSDRLAIQVWTLSLVVLAIAVYFPLRRLVGRPRRPKDRGLYRRVLSAGWKLATANAALILNPRVAVAVLAAIKSAASAGVYSVATAAAEALLISARALALAAFRRVAGGGPSESRWVAIRSVRHAVLLAGVGCALVPPILYVALPAIVGSGYGAVPTILVALIPAIMFGAMLEAAFSFFSVQLERPAVIAKATTFMLAVNLPLTFALVTLAGPWGAGLAASIASTVAAIPLFRRFFAETGASPRDVLPGRRELRDYRVLAGSVMGSLARVRPGGARP